MKCTINIKTSTLPKFIYRFKAIPIQNPIKEMYNLNFYSIIEIDKLTLKFVQKCKEQAK